MANEKELNFEEMEQIVEERPEIKRMIKAFYSLPDETKNDAFLMITNILQYENLTVTVDSELQDNYVSYNFETRQACIFAKTTDDVMKGVYELERSNFLSMRE